MQDQNSPLIDVLNLSTRSYNCLRRSGLHTVAQVAALSDEEILAIRQLGPKTLAEIHEKLMAYLAEHPLPGEAKESPLEPEPQAIEPPPSLPPSPPPDPIPLDVLGLSIRPHNALVWRGDITTVGQLARMSDEEIKAVRNIGPKSLAEIKEKLKAHLAGHPLPTELAPSEEKPKSPPSIKPTSSPEKIRPSICPLKVLNLSFYPYNALMDAGITTVEQLTAMSDSEIRSVPGIGPSRLAKIKWKLEDYLAVHPLPTEPMPKVFNSAQQKGIPLDEISVERLALPESLRSLLQRASVQTIGDLAQQPREKWAQYVDIAQRLNRYLTWLVEQDETTWAGEVAGRGVSPIYRLELAETSLETLIEELLSPLTIKQGLVIRWRFGLRGAELSLTETGNRLGLTRERVRQIQNKALDILKKSRRRPIIRLLSKFMLYLLEQAGGLMNEAQIEAALRRELLIGNVNPVGVARLAFKLDANIKQFRKAKAWGLRSYPLDEVRGVQARLAKVLEKEHTPLPIDEMVARFKSTRFYHNRQDALNDSFILACLRVHPNISIDQDNQCGLTKWERHRTDQIIQALREIGKPAHYAAIAEHTNKLLPTDLQATPHNIHAELGRRTDLFVRVGHGIYGLKEWGLPDDGSLANAAQRVLDETGKPLHYDTIADRVLETWRARRSSVYVALQSDDRFVNIGRGVYWLRERMAEGKDIEQSADFGDLFGKRLGRWQAELGVRITENKTSYDTHAEADAIRQAGLDFLE